MWLVYFRSHSKGLLRNPTFRKVSWFNPADTYSMHWRIEFMVSVWRKQPLSSVLMERMRWPSPEARQSQVLSTSPQGLLHVANQWQGTSSQTIHLSVALKNLWFYKMRTSMSFVSPLWTVQTSCPSFSARCIGTFIRVEKKGGGEGTAKSESEGSALHFTC